MTGAVRARSPTQRTTVLATSASTPSTVSPLAFSGLNPWSPDSIQWNCLGPFTFRAALVSAGFAASESRVPETNSTGIVRRGKCSLRSFSGLPAACSG